MCKNINMCTKFALQTKTKTQTQIHMSERLWSESPCVAILGTCEQEATLTCKVHPLIFSSAQHQHYIGISLSTTQPESVYCDNLSEQSALTKYQHQHYSDLWSTHCEQQSQREADQREERKGEGDPSRSLQPALPGNHQFNLEDDDHDPSQNQPLGLINY